MGKKTPLPTHIKILLYSIYKRHSKIQGHGNILKGWKRKKETSLAISTKKAGTTY